MQRLFVEDASPAQLYLFYPKVSALRIINESGFFLDMSAPIQSGCRRCYLPRSAKVP